MTKALSLNRDDLIDGLISDSSLTTEEKIQWMASTPGILPDYSHKFAELLQVYFSEHQSKK